MSVGRRRKIGSRCMRGSNETYRKTFYLLSDPDEAVTVPRDYLVVSSRGLSPEVCSSFRTVSSKCKVASISFSAFPIFSSSAPTSLISLFNSAGVASAESSATRSASNLFFSISASFSPTANAFLAVSRARFSASPAATASSLSWTACLVGSVGSVGSVAAAGSVGSPGSPLDSPVPCLCRCACCFCARADTHWGFICVCFCYSVAFANEIYIYEMGGVD